MSSPTLAGELNRALCEAMAGDPSVYLLGEDLVDPYGGAFKVTSGLSDRFGMNRVRATPISESAVVGIAVGMALRGLRPVVEIMFGDFLTLAADQIINHACKWRFVSGDRVRVPVVVRAPMGGGRAYGATHSQSLEARFAGIPGLTVAAVSRHGDPARVLLAAVDDDDPVLLVEPKLDYPRPVIRDDTEGFSLSMSQQRYPTARFAPQTEPAVLLLCYGSMSAPCLEAAVALRDGHGVAAEVLIVSRLHPLDLAEAVERARTHGRVVVAEEGPRSFGWGAEVAASLTDACFDALEAPVARVGAADTPLAAAPDLETAALPDGRAIVRAALALWQ